MGLSRTLTVTVERGDIPLRTTPTRVRSKEEKLEASAHYLAGPVSQAEQGGQAGKERGGVIPKNPFS